MNPHHCQVYFFSSMEYNILTIPGESLCDCLMFGTMISYFTLPLCMYAYNLCWYTKVLEKYYLVYITGVCRVYFTPNRALRV